MTTETDVWLAAATVDPGRRDREAVLADAVREGLGGGEPCWAALGSPALQRRVGYLLDVAHTMRGQTPEEAVRLAEVRASLACSVAEESFWPGERPLPAGTDPVAERWGFRRGCNLARLKATLRGPVGLLPAG